ncbi:MAG: hypothetical protein PVF30_08150, partial [Desulfobacterales bacterium]
KTVGWDVKTQRIQLVLYRMGNVNYSGCQKNVPIAERFFATTLMPPSFFRNTNMTSGINHAGMRF